MPAVLHRSSRSAPPLRSTLRDAGTSDQDFIDPSRSEHSDRRLIGGAEPAPSVRGKAERVRPSAHLRRHCHRRGHRRLHVQQTTMVPNHATGDAEANAPSRTFTRTDFFDSDASTSGRRADNTRGEDGQTGTLRLQIGRISAIGRCPPGKASQIVRPIRDPGGIRPSRPRRSPGRRFRGSLPTDSRSVWVSVHLARSVLSCCSGSPSALRSESSALQLDSRTLRVGSQTPARPIDAMLGVCFAGPLREPSAAPMVDQQIG